MQSSVTRPHMLGGLKPQSSWPTPSGTLSFGLSVLRVCVSEAGAGVSAVMRTMLPVHETRLILTHEHSLQISEHSFYPFFPIRPGASHFLNSGLAWGLSLWLVCPTRLWGHNAASIPRSGLLKPTAALPFWLLYHYVARGYFYLM